MAAGDAPDRSATPADARAAVPLTRGTAPGRGPGWDRVAAAVREQVPPEEIETIYLFQPIRRQGREWGTAVVTRRDEAEGRGRGRLRVYTAQYMLVLRGKERGQVTVDLEEVGLSPADVLAQVMQATVERGGETQPPLEAGREVWYEG